MGYGEMGYGEMGYGEMGYREMGYGRTDQWTDGRMDKASYRDAWTHLKSNKARSYIQVTLLLP